MNVEMEAGFVYTGVTAEGVASSASLFSFAAGVKASHEQHFTEILWSQEGHETNDKQTTTASQPTNEGAARTYFQ